MPIVVSHNPPIEVIGALAYETGRGQQQKYLDDLRLREQAARRQEEQFAMTLQQQEAARLANQAFQHDEAALARDFRANEIEAADQRGIAAEKRALQDKKDLFTWELTQKQKQRAQELADAEHWARTNPDLKIPERRAFIAKIQAERAHINPVLLPKRQDESPAGYKKGVVTYDEMGNAWTLNDKGEVVSPPGYQNRGVDQARLRFDREKDIRKTIMDTYQMLMKQTRTVEDKDKGTKQVSHVYTHHEAAQLAIDTAMRLYGMAPKSGGVSQPQPKPEPKQAEPSRMHIDDFFGQRR